MTTLVHQQWDESDQGVITPAAGAVDLARRGDQIRTYLYDLTRSPGPGPSSVRLAACGNTQIRAAMERLARVTTTTVRNASVRDTFDISGHTTELNAAAHRRGVVMDRVINETTRRQYPLLPLTALFTRRLVVAPVRLGMIVVDGRRLVFPGPRLDSGEGAMWVTTDRDVVAVASELLDAQLARGLAIPTLAPTEAHQRWLQVLTHLVNGLTDSAIARRVGVSVRCVEKDIHAIKEIAGVDNRMDLVWSLGYTSDRFGSAAAG